MWWSTVFLVVTGVEGVGGAGQQVREKELGLGRKKKMNSEFGVGLRLSERKREEVEQLGLGNRRNNKYLKDSKKF